MTAPAKTLRARRGRVLLVGDSIAFEPLVAHVRSSATDAAASPILVENLFQAMGEVTVAGSQAPVATVVIDDRLLDSSATYALEAMRRVDPALRLVVLARSGDQQPWSERGFDDCISHPMKPGDLGKLIEDDSLNLSGVQNETRSPAASAPPRNGENKPSAPRAISLDELRTKLASAPPRLRIEPESDDDLSHRLQEDLPADIAEHSAESPSSTPMAPPPEPVVPNLTTQNLGDSDLVDAVISPAGNVPDLAMQIIRQQTGWHDIAIVAEPPSPSGPHVGKVELAWEGRRFGWLTGSSATSNQLQSWGAWLSRWLALDATHREFRMHALQDDLTGAWNRRFFDAFLAQAIHHAATQRRPVTVMVFDLDNFKSFNDEFGHEAGDEILRETVKLLNSVIRQGDRVCRIGGDEFAVIFADPEAPRQLGSKHPESVDIIARRFQDQICKMKFPKLAEQAPGTISISAGLATFPWDGHDPQTLLRKADQLALESKRGGKNAITLGRGTAEFCRMPPS